MMMMYKKIMIIISFSFSPLLRVILTKVLVEVDSKDREFNEITPATENSNTNVTKKRKKDSPSPIALEPCAGNKAAVLSLLVRLPTGKIENHLHFQQLIFITNHSYFLKNKMIGGLLHSPPGQSAGLAVASALVTLGNPRRPSIDLNNPKDTNKSNKRKQSQHPDNL
jgi:hypothetical protein